MQDTSISLVLLSGLFGVFLDDKGSFVHCLEYYQRLKTYGMEIVFVAERPLEDAVNSLKGLSPTAPVIGKKGSLFIPEGHILEGMFSGKEKFEDAVPAVEGFLDALRARNRIVIPVGVGGGESAFLRLTSLAALMPDGRRPELPESVTVYNCIESGPHGWNEWADLMTRRIKIIETKRGMRWTRE